MRRTKSAFSALKPIDSVAIIFSLIAIFLVVAVENACHANSPLQGVSNQKDNQTSKPTQHAIVNKSKTALKHSFTVGLVFHDVLANGQKGPEMVVIPSGSFVMGSHLNEAERFPDEGPIHTVTFVKPFAFARTEVTVAQFRDFVQTTGYVSSAERFGGSNYRDHQTGVWLWDEFNWRHDHMGRKAADHWPVVHVSWVDASEYARWLTDQTSQVYRLPTEAEFEYVSRAGNQGPYPWGTGSPSTMLANLKGDGDYKITPVGLWYPTESELDDAQKGLYHNTPIAFANYADGYGGPAPVAQFQANSFKVFDIIGNVWEWQQDCYHPSYYGAPSDGRAWFEENGGRCDYRVVRGASWYCFPRHVRAANRWAKPTPSRGMYTGFRVARDL